jgi:hypothetical protein
MDDLVLLCILIPFAWDGLKSKYLFRQLEKARSDWGELLIAVEELAETAAQTQEFEKGQVLSMKLASAWANKYMGVLRHIYVGKPKDIERHYSMIYRNALTRDYQYV